MAELRLNLTNVSALVVDRDLYSQGITRQILRGFGLQFQHHARTAKEAQEFLEKNKVELCLVEADLPDMTGYKFVRWLRRHEDEAIRFLPVLILTGYTQAQNVAAGRDCGANSIVRKPFSPKTVFDHIAFAAGTKRAYLESPNYIGPDRRFQDIETTHKRRATDRAREEEDAPDATAADGAELKAANG